MKKVFFIVLAVIMILLGLYLMMNQFEAMFIICWLFAATLLVNGIINIFNYFSLKSRRFGFVSPWSLIGAVVSVIFGIILISNAYLNFAVDMILLYIIAIWFVIGGVIRIVLAVDLKKLGSKNWIWIVILGVLFIICGVISFIHPVILGVTLAVLLSVNMFICGIDLLALALSSN